jgi:hypothetical protein
MIFRSDTGLCSGKLRGLVKKTGLKMNCPVGEGYGSGRNLCRPAEPFGLQASLWLLLTNSSADENRNS